MSSWRSTPALPPTSPASSPTTIRRWPRWASPPLPSLAPNTRCPRWWPASLGRWAAQMQTSRVCVRGKRQRGSWQDDQAAGTPPPKQPPAAALHGTFTRHALGCLAHPPIARSHVCCSSSSKIPPPSWKTTSTIEKKSSWGRGRALSPLRLAPPEHGTPALLRHRLSVERRRCCTAAVAWPHPALACRMHPPLRDCVAARIAAGSSGILYQPFACTRPPLHHQCCWLLKPPLRSRRRFRCWRQPVHFALPLARCGTLQSNPPACQPIPLNLQPPEPPPCI